MDCIVYFKRLQLVAHQYNKRTTPKSSW